MQPGSLKEREDEGFAPDKNDDSLNPANRQNSDNTPADGFWNPEGWDAEYPGDGVARPNKKNGSGSINPNLGAEESGANPISGNTTPGLNGAENALSGAASSSANIANNLTPASTGWNKVIIRGITRKRATQIGGGMGGIGFLIAIYLAGSSLFLIQIKQLLTGSTNKISSAISINNRSRRMNSLVRIIKVGDTKFRTEAFLLKADEAGINVVKDEKGKITKLVSKIGEEEVELVLEGKSAKQTLKDIRNLYKTEAGREFANKIDDISREVGSRFAGPVTRKKVYEKFLGIFYNNDYIKTVLAQRAAREGTEEAATDLAEAPPGTALAHINAEANLVQKEFVDSLSPEQLARITGPEGTVSSGLVVDDIGQSIAEQADETKDAVKGSLSETIQKSTGEGIQNAVVDNADEVLTTFAKEEATDPGVLKTLASKLGPRIAGAVSKIAAKLGVDVTTLWREGCRTKGTIDLVKSTRNIYLAIELAKFAIRLYTVSDHQRAGLASSTAVQLMSIYLQGTIGSSGIQSMLTGAPASIGSKSAYSVGYGDIGVLVGLSRFLNKIPAISPSNCKIATNPLTQAAGTIAGGTIAGFTGGTANAVLSGSSLTFAIGLTVINEIAFGILTPMLISSVTGALISGFEGIEEKGGLVASGSQVVDSMNFGAAGNLPVKTADLDKAIGVANDFRKDEQRRQSFAKRYLDLNNADSLLARASLMMPVSLFGLSSTLQSNFSLGSIASPVTSITSLFGSKSYAASDCEDVSVQEFGAAATEYCSPVLGYAVALDIEQTQKILLENNQILLSGDPSPGSDYEKFVNNCFSGRPGVLHPAEFNSDGTSDPIDPTCVNWATYGDFLGSFPGDIVEPVDGPDAPERVPTKKERFAAMYGFKVDEKNILSDLNGELSPYVTSTNPTADNVKIYFLGDSLTAGMQSLAGTDPTKDYLKRTFDAAGWSSLVNAQGCRGIYQPQGPINGDGSSCPAESIVDGLTALNNDLPTVGNDAYGTFVIGLGGNAYERGASGNLDQTLFKEKVAQLIGTIKQNDPKAFIYWINLTSSDNNQSRLDKNILLQNVISSYPADQNIKLLDWNDYVQSVNSTPETTDDVGFADTVHHTPDGYKKKVDWLLKNIPLPGGSLKQNITTGTNTDNIPCADGTTDDGVVDGYEDNVLRKIRICDVVVGSQKIKWVNSQISASVKAMLTQAVADGVPLGGGAYRSRESQIVLWQQRCGVDYPITSPWDPNICHGAQLARPGHSTHQMGLGIDSTCSGSRIETTTDPCFKWLELNAMKYGLYEWGNDEKLPVSPSRNKGGYEPWHWSVNGS